jgi:succinoglycan biosynthesis protein ExoO
MSNAVMHKTKVSVIVAAYNAEQTLERCVRSILEQDHRILEVIIVDDQSTDSTLSVALKLSKQYERVISIGRSKNGGPGAARNTGIDRATGEWIAIVDADDYILKNRISTMLQAGLTNNVDVVFDNILYIPRRKNESSGVVYLKNTNLFGPLTLTCYIDSHLDRRNVPVLGFLKPLMRKELLDKYSIRYDVSLFIGEDTHLILQCFAFGARALIIESTGYVYVRNTTSISYAFDYDKAYNYSKKVQEFLDLYKEKFDSFENDAIERLIRHSNNRLTAKKITSKPVLRNIFINIPTIASDKKIFALVLKNLSILVRSFARGLYNKI